MADDITEAIRGLTERTKVYRQYLANRRLNEMPLELKGIRGKALKAAANLERINAAYDKFNEAAPIHAADVEGLAPQIEALQSDLAFASQILGNSATGSSNGATKPEETKTPLINGSGASPESAAPGGAQTQEISHG